MKQTDLSILKIIIVGALFYEAGMSHAEADAIDIEKEYQLIKSKQSQLSSAQRKVIVERYEAMEAEIAKGVAI